MTPARWYVPQNLSSGVYNHVMETWSRVSAAVNELAYVGGKKIPVHMPSLISALNQAQAQSESHLLIMGRDAWAGMQWIQPVSDVCQFATVG